MAFRTKRQRNYDILRQKGFLKFEAQALSKVPKKTPYLPNVIRGRGQILARARKEQWSQARYERYIKDIYRRNDWVTTTRAGKEKLSPWAMLRDAEDKHRNKHPEYNSPWLKKVKRWRDFQQKYEAGKAKYPVGKAYKTKTQEAKERAKGK